MIGIGSMGVSPVGPKHKVFFFVTFLARAAASAPVAMTVLAPWLKPPATGVAPRNGTPIGMTLAGTVSTIAGTGASTISGTARNAAPPREDRETPSDADANVDADRPA